MLPDPSCPSSNVLLLHCAVLTQVVRGWRTAVAVMLHTVNVVHQVALLDG